MYVRLTCNQGLLPTAQDAQSKHDLTVKLERLLNEEWPGKDFTVHAFGSTENLLATHKSDCTYIMTDYADWLTGTVDVCIETEWTGFERQVCELSRFMARSNSTSLLLNLTRVLTDRRYGERGLQIPG